VKFLEVFGNWAAAHPGLEIRVTPPLQGHPGLVRLLLDRAREALGI